MMTTQNSAMGDEEQSARELAISLVEYEFSRIIYFQSELNKTIEQAQNKEK